MMVFMACKCAVGRQAKGMYFTCRRDLEATRAEYQQFAADQVRQGFEFEFWRERSLWFAPFGGKG
jgi:hypothetical protein